MLSYFFRPQLPAQKRHLKPSLIHLPAAFFYNVVVSWSIWYTVATLLGMDWEHCGHWYNTDTCWSRQVRYF
jgi:hypothetical protein